MRTFRKHQLKAFTYVMKTKHPALFMKMRLGKCMVTIRRVKLYKPLDQEKGLKVLVVAPSSALGGWCDELTLEEQSHVLVTGSREEKLEKLQSDVSWYLVEKSCFLHVPELRNIHNWDAVIIDESIIRNPRAKITQYFLKYFRDCPHRWLDTGTPNPENDLELWPQLAWLDGHAFGYRNFWNFRAQMFQPDSTGYGWVARPGTQRVIKETLAKRCFIMSHRDAGVEISRDYIVRYLELPKPIRAIYDKAEQDFELQGKQTLWATVKYGWLRQLCGGFVEGERVWGGKVEELTTLIQGELKGEPVVVFFNFNNELYHVSDYLTEQGIPNTVLSGATTIEDREARRKRWANGECDVILIQQAVAQMGMDLSRADTAIFYSQTPSNLANLQVTDRIVSLSKNTTLLYLYLIVKDSVDSDLYSALKAKKFSSDLTLSRALQFAIQERLNAR